ncbi:MAG TPA: hypothetical protein VED41_11340 [Solirubrobacteraceae bacterium]|nr:hypothetical protein [Solirubrobacteraceae bacterium]
MRRAERRYLLDLVSLEKLPFPRLAATPLVRCTPYAEMWDTRQHPLGAWAGVAP